MVINSKSVVFVNGRPARVLGRRFNAEVRRFANVAARITDANGKALIPSKGADWMEVAKMVRAGKATQARVAK